MDPLWLTAAGKLVGLREIVGSKDEPRIVGFFAAAGASWVKDDETAWCAAFVGAMLVSAGLKGTGLLNARSYLNWGVALKAPVPGCVVVFKRGNSNWQGHVAFFLKKAGGRVLVRGGNQGNAVSDAWYSEANVLGYRWPAGVAQPTNGSASFPDYVAHARLMLGSYSEEVAVWQRGLNALGQRPALKVDKDFGPATRGATITFQKKRQLPPDAVVDGPDWIALETLIEALG